MLSFFKPNKRVLLQFLQAEKGGHFTYEAVGATQKPAAWPANFQHDRNEIELGRGQAVFEAAKKGIRQWQMFPGGWVEIFSKDCPIEPNQVVAMCAHVCGLWWSNACRIVFVTETPTQFGFAYGTLPSHVEMGEELFEVKMEADGRVFYRISAFSRPRHWAARLAFPLARWYQRRFVRESKAAMLRFVKEQMA